MEIWGLATWGHGLHLSSVSRRTGMLIAIFHTPRAAKVINEKRNTNKEKVHQQACKMQIPQYGLSQRRCPHFPMLSERRAQF